MKITYMVVPQDFMKFAAESKSLFHRLVVVGIPAYILMMILGNAEDGPDLIRILETTLPFIGLLVLSFGTQLNRGEETPWMFLLGQTIR